MNADLKKTPQENVLTFLVFLVVFPGFDLTRVYPRKPAAKFEVPDECR
jgi:hypothetical protein